MQPLSVYLHSIVVQWECKRLGLLESEVGVFQDAAWGTCSHTPELQHSQEYMCLQQNVWKWVSTQLQLVPIHRISLLDIYMRKTCKPCDLQQLTWSCFCVICKFGHDLCAGILGSNDCFRQFIESFFFCWGLPIFLEIKLQLNSNLVDEDVAYHNWLLISLHLIRQHPRVGQITSKSTKRTAVISVAFCWNKTNCPPIISRWCRSSSLSQTIVVWALLFLDWI